MGVLHEGPIELKVVFPAGVKAGAEEPLLAAGTPEFTDSLYVIEWPPGNQIELVGDHSGHGGPSSDVIPVTPGRVYSLWIDMGALYPPPSPPFSLDHRAAQTAYFKTRIRVEMDGRVVLDKAMASYHAPPWAVESGRNDITMNPCGTRFSGRILSATRLPPPEFVRREDNGIWRIRCVFPLERPNVSFPFLSSGRTGAGTLVHLDVLPGDRVRFGLDEWGIGGGASDAIKVAPQSEHVVGILIGPDASGVNWPRDWNVAPGPLGRLGHSLRIWLDGRLVWTARLRGPPAPPFEVGANRQGFSTAQADYPGPIRSDPYLPGEAREFLERNLREGP
jgi:hypothetical protein